MSGDGTLTTTGQMLLDGVKLRHLYVLT